MNSQEYMEYHAKMCQRMIEITKQKNADYTGASGDPFKNFKMVEVFGVSSVEQGFFTRMTDKFARISTFIQKGVFQVKDESIEDTLLDFANYCILLSGYIKSKKSSSAPCEPK